MAEVARSREEVRGVCSAEEGVDDLLEIKQPERQAQVSRREHLRFFAEAAAIFIMRIDQEDTEIRPGIEDLLQDDCDAARFADAGGADDGEMPADQEIDVDVNVDVRVLLQRADIDMAVARDTMCPILTGPFAVTLGPDRSQPS